MEMEILIDNEQVIYYIIAYYLIIINIILLFIVFSHKLMSFVMYAKMVKYTKVNI